MNVIRRRNFECFEHSGVKLEIPRSFLLEDIRQELRDGRYELDKISEILHVLQPRDVVLELGGGIGFTSTKIAQESKVARVVSVEVHPQLSHIARRTFQLNGVSVQLVETASADSGGEAVPKLAPGLLEKVYLSTAQSLLTELDPSVLVLDIKGKERAILKNTSFSSIRAIVIKLHPEAIGFPEIGRIFSVLSNVGFLCQSSTGTVATFTSDHFPSQDNIDEQVDLLTRSQFFDAGWYLTTYPDVNASGINPIYHYIKFGADEDRNPSAMFDTKWYRENKSACRWQ